MMCSPVRVSRRSGGFTLVELMIVVVILGILAATAIPAFSRYVRRAKTVEATMAVHKMHQGAVVYLEQFRENSPGGSVFGPGMVPLFGGSPTPASPPSANKYPANASLWQAQQGWVNIGFAMEQPHYYQYAMLGTGGIAAALVEQYYISQNMDCMAIGDLDGDGQTSLFARSFSFTISVGVSGFPSTEPTSTPLEVIDELE